MLFTGFTVVSVEKGAGILRSPLRSVLRPAAAQVVSEGTETGQPFSTDLLVTMHEAKRTSLGEQES